MITTYVGRQVEVPEDFKPICEAKLRKYDKFFRDEPSAVVKLSKQRNKERVEITITAGGMIYRGEVTDETYRNALDLAVDVIERQIRKNKTKLEKRLREGIGETIAPLDEIDEPIIRTKEFQLHPMSTEEAILQMNLLGHSFFVFEDAATAEVNVVYRRNDGNYGLMIPTR